MQKTSGSARGALYILAAALLWSTGGLFIKMIPWSPLSINSARCLIALVITAAASPPKKGVAFSKATLLAGLCFALTATFLTLATKLTTAANAILLQYTSPLFIIFFEAIRRRRLPRPLDLICCGGILLGIFLCCTGSLGTGGMVGNVIALLSGICFALMFLLSAQPSANPTCVNLIGFLLGFVIGLPWLVREREFSGSILALLLVLGAGQFCLSYALFGRGIRLVSPLTANFLSTLEPVLNPIWVALFYGEALQLLTAAGGLVTIASAAAYSAFPALLQRQHKRKPPQP